MKKILLTMGLLLAVSLAVFAQGSNRVPLPGNSQANKLLQRDTLVPVVSLAKVYAKNCQSVAVTDTMVLKQMSVHKDVIPGETYGVWEELWTVKACSDRMTYKIRFVQDLAKGTGTSFFINEIRKNGIVVNKKAG